MDTGHPLHSADEAIHGEFTGVKAESATNLEDKDDAVREAEIARSSQPSRLSLEERIEAMERARESEGQLRQEVDGLKAEMSALKRSAALVSSLWIVFYSS